MAATPRNAAIGAADFSARCASRAEATQEFGAAGNVEAMAIGKRFAKADGDPSTKLSTIEDRQRDGKTRRGRKPIGEGSSVTENPPAALSKQKTYRRKKRLSRTTPLPNAFGAGNGLVRRHEQKRFSNGDGPTTRKDDGGTFHRRICSDGVFLNRRACPTLALFAGHGLQPSPFGWRQGVRLWCRRTKEQETCPCCRGLAS
jgi:hypothetical protein